MPECKPAWPSGAPSAIIYGVDSDDRHLRAGYAPGRSIENRVIVVLVIPLEYRP